MLSYGCKSLSCSLSCQRRPLSCQTSGSGVLVGGGWIQLSLSFSPCQASLPPSLKRALPLAECWDSFTEAAGCQESRSPRKAGQMYVGHCESEGGFSFSPFLLFSPPFCAFVPLWLPPFLLLSEQITLMCAGPPYFEMIFLDGALRLRPSLFPTY